MDSTPLHGLKALIDTKGVFSAVKGNLVKVGLNQLLFLHKLDIGEGVSSELDGLVEAGLSAVRDIDNFDDLGHEPGVEHVGLGKLGLELGRSSNHKAGDIGL